MRLLIPVLFLVSMLFAQEDAVLKYSRQVPRAEFIAVLPDGLGNVVVVGRSNDATFPVPRNAAQPRLSAGACAQNTVCYDVVVAKFRVADGEMIAATFLGGTGQDLPTAMAVDAQGSVYIAGTTTGAWPATEGAFQKQPLAAGTSGFVAKLNSSLTGAFFSTYLTGAGTTRPTAIATDFQGNVYITGVTDARDFPTTSGAYRTTGGVGTIFVSKLNSAGTGLVASTLLGIGTPAGIASDTSGNMIVAGTTSSASFPVTGDAVQGRIAREGSSDLFLSRLNSLGNQLQYSTFIGGQAVDQATDLAADSTGALYISGTTFSSSFPGTTEALGDAGSGFVLKWANSAIAWTRPLRANGPVSVDALQIADDAVVAMGVGNGTHFPTTSGSYRRCAASDFNGRTPFFARIARDTGAVNYATLLPSNTTVSRWAAALSASRVFTASFLPTSFEKPPNLLRLYGLADAPAVRVDCAVNAASYRAVGVTPGMAITIFGSGIGPAQGMIASLDSNGKVPTNVGGVRVLFGETPAPLLYVRQDQINALVPFSVAVPGNVVMRVENEGRTLASATIPTRVVDAGIFRLGATEFGAILNEDNSLNTPDNPAPRGSVITFWATGAGPFASSYEDGSVIGENASSLALPVRVSIAGSAAEIFYSGAAPGLVAGITQFNVRIPANARISSRDPIAITIGEITVADSAYVSVK